MVLLFYTTYISIDLAHLEIFRAKVGKGGISCQSRFMQMQVIILVQLRTIKNSKLYILTIRSNFG